MRSLSKISRQRIRCLERPDLGDQPGQRLSGEPESNASYATTSSFVAATHVMTSTTNRRLRRLAKRYLMELESAQLEVVLIPAPEPRHSTHQVRAVQEQNCEWYRQFCEEHPSNRRGSKLRTKIKRRLTILALLALANGRCETSYA